MQATARTYTPAPPGSRRSHRSVRRGRLARLLLLGPLVYLGWTTTLAQQDITALIEASRGHAPRWMSAVEAARHGSSIAPSVVLADASREVAGDTPDYAVTNAAPGTDPAVVRGLEVFVKESAPKAPPARTPVNRSRKGDRFMSMAPDRQMVETAAGSIYTLGNILTERSSNDLPRVAFVRPAMPSSTQLASAGDGSSGPLDLAKLAMARNVAATSVSYASAYAPSGITNVRAPFDALLGNGPLAGTGDEAALETNSKSDPYWWAKRPLPASVITAKEQRCLAEAIYFEARGEPVDGRPPSPRWFSTGCATPPIQTRSARWSTRTGICATVASSPSPATASATASPRSPSGNWPRRSLARRCRVSAIWKRSAPRPTTMRLM